MWSHIKRHVHCLSALVCMCLFLSGCKQQINASRFKIVSLSPATTEIIFALNAQDHLVGVTTYCTYPEETRTITQVGDFSNPSLERIVGLKPDLVIVTTPEQNRIKQQLEQLHIHTYTSEPRTMKDVYTDILEIGKQLNATEKAESIVQYMNTIIKPVEGPKKRVYVELSPRPLVTIGNATFLNELIDLAGGKNIFSDHDKAYPVVSPEAVILRDPEIIIVLHPQNFGERIGWNNVYAVRNGRIFTDLDQDHLMRPGPRLVFGFRALCNVIND
jgi:iron complex transport system substrate-binding protein